MFIVIYRPHNELHCDTQHYGPFDSWGAAYDKLCSLPAIGSFDESHIIANTGVKYVEELLTVTPAATQNRVDHARDVEIFRKGNGCGEGITGPRWLATQRANREEHWALYAAHPAA